MLAGTQEIRESFFLTMMLRKNYPLSFAFAKILCPIKFFLQQNVKLFYDIHTTQKNDKESVFLLASSITLHYVHNIRLVSYRSSLQFCRYIGFLLPPFSLELARSPGPTLGSKEFRNNSIEFQGPKSTWLVVISFHGRGASSLLSR